MLRRFLVAAILLLSIQAFPQTAEQPDTAYRVVKPAGNQNDTIVKLNPKPAFKPIIGLGTGMFSFYGDLYEKKFVNPQVSRIGYELSVAQRLTPTLDLNFYVLFGKLGANERSLTRNINFQSEIRVGGVQLMYTFANWLPGKRLIHPYVTTGIESFEFLSKTDLRDKNGNLYHYWSDGSIRNLPEDAPNAGSAIFLQRDYTYESDIRELNLDNFGKYPERSFAVPVGAGALMHLSDRMDFRIGATLHFTMTDYLDGITENSIGNRQGNSKNDSYMMTSFSLRYDLFGIKKSASDSLGEDYFDDAQIFALDEDEDLDGVKDNVDACLGTPPNIKVDAKGCPLDSDNDGVPDSMDDEPNSIANAVVDERGVALSDSLIALRYDMYIDSTGKYGKIVVLESENPQAAIYAMNQAKKKYTVKLGEYTTGVPSDMMSKFLSIPDIESATTSDSATIYTAGRYATEAEANQRRDELIKAGITGATVVMRQNDKFVTPPPVVAGNQGGQQSSGGQQGNDGQQGDNGQQANGSQQGNGGQQGTGGQQGNGGQQQGSDPQLGSNVPSSEEVVFRVQLGAYRRKISKSIFGVNDVVEIKTDDGLYKYVAGSYKTFDEAAQRKVDMLLKGFPDAFVVAYKGGKRVPLTSVGATPAPRQSLSQEDLTEPNKPMSTADKQLVTFKVQVGVFRNEPPAEMQEKYNQMKNVQKETTTAGLTRYTVGSSNDYNAAVKLKNEIREKYGIDDAFVVAFFKDQYISIQEALELMK